VELKCRAVETTEDFKLHSGISTQLKQVRGNEAC
jgi:hypothetical protein